jgi:hypothetical protein
MVKEVCWYRSLNLKIDHSVLNIGYFNYMTSA